MGLTNDGRDHIAGAIVGLGTAFNNANAYLGVGNSSTGFAAAQTDLQGASKERDAMEATYPTRVTNVLTFRSIFGPTQANFAWAEFGVFNAAAAGTMLSRAVSAMGTKPSGETWQLTVTITVSNP